MFFGMDGKNSYWVRFVEKECVFSCMGRITIDPDFMKGIYDKFY